MLHTDLAWRIWNHAVAKRGQCLGHSAVVVLFLVAVLGFVASVVWLAVVRSALVIAAAAGVYSVADSDSDPVSDAMHGDQTGMRWLQLCYYQ